jgi:hypothetical protein
MNWVQVKGKKNVPYLEISVGTKEQKEYEFELAFEREFYQQYEPKTEVFWDKKEIQNYHYNLKTNNIRL